MKRLLLVLYFTFFVLYAALAQDSCHLRITLLTCTPGEELYSTFGHTAIRVQDSSAASDLVYNYGTFEFSPDFYSKFIRGKLLYSLSVENFPDFLYEYQIESRSVVEQPLQLTCQEKQKLYTALQINALEENRHYRYDFLFDNCTTRARDIVAKNTNTPLVFKNILPQQIPTFRTLIHSYLDKGHEHWSKLGIDILLGVQLDEKVKNEQAMFLPDWLLKGFDSGIVNNHPLVTSPQQVLTMPSSLNDTSFFTPLFVFSALLILAVATSFIKSKWATNALTVFDFLFFFILGLAACLLIFMWFGTDHKVCRNNYNLLWALPTHLIVAFIVHKKTRFTKLYFTVVLWLTIVLALAWFFLPQQMNEGLFPLILLIIFRCWYLSKNSLYGTKTNQL